jgi:ribosomal protein S18 acetylase RimI-like enzyme
MVWKKPQTCFPAAKSMNKPSFEVSRSEARIFKFLFSVNSQFTPPLREKVNVPDYARKLAVRAENIFLVVGGYDVGHAAYYSNDLQTQTGYLTSICVKKEFRGSKMAESLLDKVLLGAKKDGMLKLILEVDSRNSIAVAFYRKHSFVDCGNSQMMRDLNKINESVDQVISS